MPLFEYACEECGKRFTFLSGVIADSSEPACPACHSVKLKKLVSRFSRGRSDDDRLDAMADKMDHSDFDDAREVRKFAREMGREMGAETGEDLADEMEELIENEAGESGGGMLGGDDGHIY